MEAGIPVSDEVEWSLQPGIQMDCLDRRFPTPTKNKNDRARGDGQQQAQEELNEREVIAGRFPRSEPAFYYPVKGPTETSNRHESSDSRGRSTNGRPVAEGSDGGRTHRRLARSDGAEGLALARSYEFDVIILDVMMPKLSGFELAKRLREGKVRTPILMLTARDAVPDIIRRSRPGGADDYMTKPFSFSELIARLRAIKRRALPPEQTYSEDRGPGFQSSKQGSEAC